MVEKVIDIISEHQGIDKSILNPNTELVSDLELNSYDVVDLICTFEETFNIEISDRAIKNFLTINDIAVFIQEQT